MLTASNDNQDIVVDTVSLRQKIMRYYLDLGLANEVASFFTATYLEKVALMPSFDLHQPIKFHGCRELGDEPSVHAVVEAYARQSSSDKNDSFGQHLSIGLSSARFEISRLRSRGAYAR